MSTVDLSAVEKIYQELHAGARNTRRKASLDRLWDSLNEMVAKGVSINSAADVNRYLKAHYQGVPAASTIANDPEGLNLLVKLAVQAAQESFKSTRAEVRQAKSKRTAEYEALARHINSDKGRALLEVTLREKDEIERENQTLRVAFSKLTNQNGFSLNNGHEVVVGPRLASSPMLGADDRKKLEHLFVALRENFEIFLDPTKGDLCHEYTGHLGVTEAVALLLKLIED